MSREFLARVASSDEEGQWEKQLLKDHLKAVSDLSGDFAAAFGSKDWASLAGLWHDLGKFSNDFQKYIRSKNGYDTEAHIENAPGRVNHSSAGALHAIKQLGVRGRILAYCIAGHHSGLADWYPSDRQGLGSLQQRLGEGKYLDQVLCNNPPDEILSCQRPESKPPGTIPHLWIRLLFSCLVDADRLDAEAFMYPEKTALREEFPSMDELVEIFNNYMDKNFSNLPDTPVNKVRSCVLSQCLARASDSPGLFSLTVPTGGGKTLSSMAFALKHALKYGKRRIIYVIPYTSILEQTAKEFRNIFKDSVIEHHSNLESDKETSKSQLACENWDAPVIVTTNVQFFESLFSAHASQTRKLHNIVNSVVVLDEAQLVQPGFLKPILSVIEELSRHYGVTFVFCTATQPAWEKRQGFDWKFNGLTNIREIIESPQSIYQQLKRVGIELPPDLNATQDWDHIARELCKYESVLCIVNTRKDCRTLYQLMPGGTYHLSALMCADHRSALIQEIKEKLKNKEPIRVISTQLVEAGVDLDFPVVYRAMAGLDSIAQAAGRCNREGKLPNDALGKVVVFVPPKAPPSGLLRRATSTSKQLLTGNHSDPLNPEIQKRYFEQLYWKEGDLDEKNILGDLEPEYNLEIQFRTASTNFKLIDDDYYVSVIVWYGQGEKLIEQLKNYGPERHRMRGLQRYIVNIPKPLHASLLKRGDLEELHPGIYVQTHSALYHEKTGFVGGEDNLQDPASYIA